MNFGMTCCHKQQCCEPVPALGYNGNIMNCSACIRISYSASSKWWISVKRGVISWAFRQEQTFQLFNCRPGKSRCNLVCVKLIERPVVIYDLGRKQSS